MTWSWSAKFQQTRYKDFGVAHCFCSKSTTISYSGYQGCFTAVQGFREERMLRDRQLVRWSQLPNYAYLRTLIRHIWLSVERKPTSHTCPKYALNVRSLYWHRRCRQIFQIRRLRPTHFAAISGLPWQTSLFQICGDHPRGRSPTPPAIWSDILTYPCIFMSHNMQVLQDVHPCWIATLGLEACTMWRILKSFTCSIKCSFPRTTTECNMTIEASSAGLEKWLPTHQYSLRWVSRHVWLCVSSSCFPTIFRARWTLQLSPSTSSTIRYVYLELPWT